MEVNNNHSESCKVNGIEVDSTASTGVASNMKDSSVIEECSDTSSTCSSSSSRTLSPASVAAMRATSPACGRRKLPILPSGGSPTSSSVTSASPVGENKVCLYNHLYFVKIIPIY